MIFGGSNKGLFGIKTSLQVGDFYFTGIASLEKGEQQKLTISGGASESKTTVRDYDYIKNRYFFVDDYYVNEFEVRWSDDLSNWLYAEERLLRQIDVYISTTYSNEEAKQGIAVINPDSSVWQNLLPVEYSGISRLQWHLPSAL